MEKRIGKLMLAILICCSLSACDENASGNNNNGKDSTAVNKDSVPVADTVSATNDSTPSADSTTGDTEIASARSIERYYVSCAMYAGATEFAFSEEGGEEDGMMLIRVPHYPEDEGAKKISIPEGMYESDENLEGPPGANPEYVGKRFRIHYDEQDEVIAIEGPVED